MSLSEENTALVSEGGVAWPQFGRAHQVAAAGCGSWRAGELFAGSQGRALSEVLPGHRGTLRALPACAAATVIAPLGGGSAGRASPPDTGTGAYIGTWAKGSSQAN